VKQRELPCHCCPIINRALVPPNLNHCRWCYIMGHKERDENFLCYHTDMLIEENVKSMKDKCGGFLKSIAQSADTLEEIRAATKITPDEDPRNRMEASQLDINSIRCLEYIEYVTMHASSHACTPYDVMPRHVVSLCVC